MLFPVCPNFEGLFDNITQRNNRSYTTRPEWTYAVFNEVPPQQTNVNVTFSDDATTRSHDGITVTEKEITLKLRLPGVEPSAVTLTTANNLVKVQWKRDDERTSSREWEIRDSFDCSKVKAELYLGVLTITIPRKPESLPAIVPITVK